MLNGEDGVMKTAVDALSCKLSYLSVRNGSMEKEKDKGISLHEKQQQRQTPLMNRLYYYRTTFVNLAIDACAHSLRPLVSTSVSCPLKTVPPPSPSPLAAPSQSLSISTSETESEPEHSPFSTNGEAALLQVVVLGAGLDMSIDDKFRECYKPNRVFAVDFPAILEKRANLRGPKCKSGLTNTITDPVAVPADLRDPGLIFRLKEAGVVPSFPTLVILECVLPYLQRQETMNLLQLLRDNCSANML